MTETTSPSAEPLPESGCVTIEPVHRADGTVDWSATRTEIQDAYKDFPPDESGAPAWQPVYNQLWAQEQEREILDRMTAVDAAVPASVPGTTAADWPPHASHHGGYVIDLDRAQRTPCTRLDIGEGFGLVFSKGVVGALSPDQQTELCLAGFEDEAPSPAQQAHLRAFAAASEYCATQTKGLPTEQHVDAYYSCLGKEVREREKEG